LSTPIRGKNRGKDDLLPRKRLRFAAFYHDFLTSQGPQQVIRNARLCKALLDRITDPAHIIETGSESYRFRRTLEHRQRSRQRGADEAVA